MNTEQPTHALSRLLEFIENELGSGNQSIAADDDLLTSGLVDSMGVMRLATFVETEFKMAVLPEDITIENFQTAQSIVLYIEAAKSNHP